MTLHDLNEMPGPARNLVLRRIDALWDVDTPVRDARRAELLTWQMARVMSRDLYLLTACMNYRCRNPRYRDDIEDAFARLHRVVESLAQRSADLPAPAYTVHSAGIAEIRSHEAFRLFGIFIDYDRLLYKIGCYLPWPQVSTVFAGFTHAYGRFKLAVIPNHGNPDIGDGEHPHAGSGDCDGDERDARI